MKAVLGIALLLSVAFAICGAHPRPPKGGPGAPPPPPPPEGDRAATNDSVTRPPKDGKRFYGQRGGDRRGKEPRDHTEGPEEDHTGEPRRDRFRGKDGSRNCTKGPEDHTDRPFRRFDEQRAPDDHTEGPGKPGGRTGGRQPYRGGEGGRRY